MTFNLSSVKFSDSKADVNEQPRMETRVNWPSMENVQTS